MILLKNFNPNLLSIDKISYKNTDAVISSIKYVMMENITNQNIDIENLLCLVFNNVDGYIFEESNEESNENKYLIFALTKNNKKSIKKKC